MPVAADSSGYPSERQERPHAQSQLQSARRDSQIHLLQERRGSSVIDHSTIRGSLIEAIKKVDLARNVCGPSAEGNRNHRITNPLEAVPHHWPQDYVRLRSTSTDCPGPELVAAVKIQQAVVTAFDSTVAAKILGFFMNVELFVMNLPIIGNARIEGRLSLDLTRVMGQRRAVGHN